MSEANLSLAPLFTVRTSALVGRDREIARLQKARDALKQQDCPTLLVYIAGPGGMGKTRFLEWLRDRPGEGELVTDIIDFYDTATHSDVTLMERIVDSALSRAGEQAPAFFEAFRNAMRIYRTQQSAGIGELRDIRARIQEQFIRAWNEMTASRPAIILLDTAEVLQFQGDAVQRRLKLPLPAMYSKSWLEDMLKNERLKRTLLVVAGRPEPEELHGELLALAGIEQRQIVLEGLDEDGVAAYIDSLADALNQMECQDEADGVRALNDEDHADLRRAFFRLTNGRPVALAILTQLYLSGQWGELAPFIEQARQPESALDPAEVRAALRHAMVGAVMRYAGFEDSGEAIQYLALLRKGMTAKRLQHIWPGRSVDDCQRIIDHLRKQTFVKLRPDGSIVLHDEVADWFDEELYSDAAGLWRAREVYRAVLRQYDADKEERWQHTGEMQAQDDLAYSEPLSDDLASLPSDEQAELDRKQIDARYRRRSLSLDALHYALRADAEKGYRRYYELAEEAFNGHIPEMDAQIHSELMAWWATPRFRDDAKPVGVDDGLVEADLALRWVQRRFNEELGSKRGTVKLVDRLLEDQSLDLDDLARLRLRLYRATALGLSQPNAEEAEHVRKEFDECISRLRKFFRTRSKSQSLRQFLIEDALAFAFYERGFFQKNTGEFGDAIDSYAQSIWYYRDLSFEANQARSLNDRAYVLAQVGELDEAELQVTDALHLRQRLGLGYLIALSLNTYGIIAALSGKTVTAVDYCRKALQIMRRLDQRGAQIMVLRAYAEALRREAARLPERVDRQRKFLQAAIERSRECVELAEEILPERSELLSEALDEYACACRDMMRLCRQDRDRCKTDEVSEYFERAKTHFEQALKAAPHGDAFAHHVVDTLINMAYLHYYNGSPDDAHAWIQRAFEQIPESVRDPRKHARSSPQRTIYPGYLSKAHSLLLRIAGDQLEALTRDEDHSAQRRARLDKLLPEAILTLYFAEVHGGNPHRIRMSRQAVYRHFKTLPSDELRYVYQNASRVSRELGLPKAHCTHMTDYLKTQFGVSVGRSSRD